MPTYHFIRTAPLLVSVEAENEQEAWTLAGHRLDDFLTDAVNDVDRVSHHPGEPGRYGIEYHGDAIYVSELAHLHERPVSSIMADRRERRKSRDQKDDNDAA